MMLGFGVVALLVLAVFIWPYLLRPAPLQMSDDWRSSQPSDGDEP
jgi:hypothetical protein